MARLTSAGATLPRRAGGRILAAALVAATLAAWLVTVDRMDGMDAGPGTDLGQLGWFTGMWVTMMAAMMLPSAAPAVLLVDALDRQAGRGSLGAGLFTLGYLLVWIGFSLQATAAQFGLDHAGLLGEDMAASSARLAAALLIFAGVYEWTPWKHACLAHCRTPFEFLTRHWRAGPLRAGFRHGLYCLGCCWLLMALLFVGGLMNLLWIAGLALLVLVEKLLPLGGRTSRVAGLAMIAWGGFLLVGGP